jgi:hypothetical protein
VGFGDDNDGIFLQLDGTVLELMIRSGGVDGTPVPQSAWNLDKLDGTGPSGITLDPTKMQIWHTDLQWLGAGRVRMVLNIGGINRQIHEFNHANIVDTVYMLNPNLPLRYELVSTGGARTMDHVCSEVTGEGIVSPAGVSKTIDRGTTLFTGVDNGELVPLISMRLKSTHINAAVLPFAVNVLSPSAAEFRMALILNPSIAGVDAASWTPLADSAVEFDISRDLTNLVSGGTTVWADYGGGGPSANSPAAPGQNLGLQRWLGANIDGVRDEFVLAAEPLPGLVNESLIGKISFRELL